ncbi:MAG: hypothetical protein PHS53_03665 [Candidatus Pacebacteria bacterium]|nr:hypothetical protein [Candidatus Paceibacterota bacterium]
MPSPMGYQDVYVSTISFGTPVQDEYTWVDFQPRTTDTGAQLPDGLYFIQISLFSDGKGNGTFVGNIRGSVFNLISPPTISFLDPEIIAVGEELTIYGGDFQQYGSSVLIQNIDTGAFRRFEYLESEYGYGHRLFITIPDEMFIAGKGDAPIPIGTHAGVYRVTVQGYYGGQSESYFTITDTQISVYPLQYEYSLGDYLRFGYSSDGLVRANVMVRRIDTSMKWVGSIAENFFPDSEETQWYIEYDVPPGVYQIFVEKTDRTFRAFSAPFTISAGGKGVVKPTVNPTTTSSDHLIVHYYVVDGLNGKKTLTGVAEQDPVLYGLEATFTGRTIDSSTGVIVFVHNPKKKANLKKAVQVQSFSFKPGA